MKKLILILIMLIAIKAAIAAPTIDNIVFIPSKDLWVDESLTIRLNCTDTNAIENVTLDAVGSDGFIIPTILFDADEGSYVAYVDPLYLKKPNNFSATITCYNNASEFAQTKVNFTVSQFDARIVKILPSEIYTGDQIEVDVAVGKNNMPITSGVHFNVYMNNVEVYPKVTPPYDPNKGWLIYLDAPQSSDTYTLQVVASYGRVNDSAEAAVTVSDKVKFSVTVDKKWVRPNESVTLSLQAFYKGNAIEVTKNNLNIRIGNAPASITAITPVSNYYTVSIQLPSIEPGTYDLVASLVYGSYTYTASTKLYFVIPVTGKIVDENKKGLSVVFRFLDDGKEVLKFYTDTTGSYSYAIPKGTYDLEIVFPQSKLYLSGVAVESFEDPVRYFELSSVDIPGLNVANLYVYEIALDYSKAKIEMKYDESKVLNEAEIKVYRCEDWNTGRKYCYGSWQEVDASIDTVRNLVTVETEGLSAYAIGTIKRISVDYTLNKEKFYLKDLIRVKGMVIDESKMPVANATIRLAILGTSINISTTTDSNGLFTIDAIAPQDAGNYTLVLSASKHPFISYETRKTISVEKSKEISLVFPDTIKIKAGKSIQQELLIINTGQEDLFNISVSLTGLPEDYCFFKTQLNQLGVGEQTKILVNFSVPSNATPQTLSASLKVEGKGISKEKTFGFTIEASDESGLPTTGRTSSLPTVSIDYIYILLFAVSSFIAAFLLKKRKLERERRKDKSMLLLAVKEQLKNKDKEVVISG